MSIATITAGAVHVDASNVGIGHAEHRRRRLEQARIAQHQLAAHFRGDAVFEPRGVGDDEAPGLAHALGHQIPIGMADRVEIDDLG